MQFNIHDPLSCVGALLEISDPPITGNEREMLEAIRDRDTLKPYNQPFQGHLRPAGPARHRTPLERLRDLVRSNTHQLVNLQKP